VAPNPITLWGTLYSPYMFTAGFPFLTTIGESSLDLPYGDKQLLTFAKHTKVEHSGGGAIWGASWNFTSQEHHFIQKLVSKSSNFSSACKVFFQTFNFR
jgi:hypothetical protein